MAVSTGNVNYKSQESIEITRTSDNMQEDNWDSLEPSLQTTEKIELNLAS